MASILSFINFASMEDKLWGSVDLNLQGCAMQP